MCGTRIETKTILIHFVVPKTKVLHQNKELLNTGFFHGHGWAKQIMYAQVFTRCQRIELTYSNFQAYCLPSSYLGATVNQDHQHTNHWMLVITQLWMNLNRVNTWFHLGNQFCRKLVSYIDR